MYLTFAILRVFCVYFICAAIGVIINDDDDDKLSIICACDAVVWEGAGAAALARCSWLVHTAKGIDTDFILKPASDDR